MKSQKRSTKAPAKLDRKTPAFARATTIVQTAKRELPRVIKKRAVGKRPKATYGPPSALSSQATPARDNARVAIYEMGRRLREEKNQKLRNEDPRAFIHWAAEQEREQRERKRSEEAGLKRQAQEETRQHKRIRAAVRQRRNLERRIIQVAHSRAHAEIVALLEKLLAKERLEHLAWDDFHPLAFFPDRFAKVDKHSFDRLDAGTQRRLLNKLAIRRKGAWKHLHKQLSNWLIP